MKMRHVLCVLLCNLLSGVFYGADGMECNPHGTSPIKGASSSEHGTSPIKGISSKAHGTSPVDSAQQLIQEYQYDDFASPLLKCRLPFKSSGSYGSFSQDLCELMNTPQGQMPSDHPTSPSDALLFRYHILSAKHPTTPLDLVDGQHPTSPIGRHPGRSACTVFPRGRA